MPLQTRFVSLLCLVIRGFIWPLLAIPALIAKLLIWLGTVGENLDDWAEDVIYELAMATKPRAWEAYKSAVHKAEEMEKKTDYFSSRLESEIRHNSPTP